MNNVYLDPNAYLQTHLDEKILESVELQSGRVGHVHLQVGDLKQARDFYVNAVGFDPTVEDFPGALFAAAGGYHHHVAMNSWNSRGVGPRASRLGLGDVAVTVPGREDLDLLVDRLKAKDVPFADDGRSVSVKDPWDTQVTLSLPGGGVDELLKS